MLFSFRSSPTLTLILLCEAALLPLDRQGLQNDDLYRLRSVNEVQFSVDSRHIAHSVIMRDRPGRPYSQIWIMDVASEKSVRIGGEKDERSHPRWSPDGKMIAYSGEEGGKHGLMLAHADGSAESFLAPSIDTNSPLPNQGESFTWSPDSKKIAFISATPGPETQQANGDPIVITRYLYKPTASEGLTHFNDNRRLHIFLVDITTKQVRQLTDGMYDEHSIDWSPDGQEILFVSNREPNPDEFFNYDVFALKLSDNSVRRITATEGCEYAPRWAPDGKSIAYLGTKRGLTDRETTMEDTHIWVMNADGTRRRELGAVIDKREESLKWAADGTGVYFTYQDRGTSRLARLSISGARRDIVVNSPGLVGDYSLGRHGEIAYALETPRDLAQLYVKTGQAAAHQLTSLNAGVLTNKQAAEVESFTFISNDNKFEVEAFLTKPLGRTATSKHPLIVNIHGGPHAQNGPAFNFKNQVYAAKGWATLQVNYRGSTGYGQLRP